MAQQIDLDYIVPGTLYLRGKTKPYFLNSIRQYDENLYWKLKHLYPKGSCLKEYKKEFYQSLNQIRKKYDLENKVLKDTHKDE